MTDNDRKKTIQALRALRKKHADSPAAALTFLVKAGIATKSGKLTRRYRKSA